MATIFGKSVRKYRIDQDMTMRGMAKLVDVSVAHLSAVETGKKNANEGLVLRISKVLNLSVSELEQLQLDAEASKKQHVIITTGICSSHAKRAVAAFARSIRDNKVDERLALEILNILNTCK